MVASLPCPFGRYTLVAALGRGGMAEIFLARALGAHGFERQFVIKRMHAHLSSDPQFTRMFVREARLSAGAGFIVMLTGEILTMPGLPKVPQAVKIDLLHDGTITGIA